MKINVCFIFLMIWIASCREKAESTVDELTYSIDTVIIDAGEKVFDLSQMMRISDIDDGNGFLYSYNSYEHSIDKVDLDKLEWVGRLPFEKEGPNGTGSYMSQFRVLDGDKMFIAAGRTSGIYTVDGKVSNRFDWQASDIKRGRIGDSERIWNQVLLNKYDHLLFSIVIDDQAKTASLKKLDTRDKSIDQYAIDPSNNYKAYTLEIDKPESRTLLDPLFFLSTTPDALIVSHEFSNEIFFYDLKNDSLGTVRYPSGILPEKVTPSKQKFEEFTDLQDAYHGYLEQARFGVPVWDELNRRYYRLSCYKEFSDERKEGQFLAEVLESNVVLSIFDSDFNLLQEALIPELNSESNKYFVKAGSLWVFENLDDELAFIRLSFNN